MVTLSLATPAGAQTVSVVTTPAGSYTNAAGSAIAKVLIDRGGLRAVVQAQAALALIAVAGGVAEFGMSNNFDTTFYANGTGDYEGQPPKRNIRNAASLMPYKVAMHVRADSNIKTMADLKGKRVGMGYSAMRTIDPMVRAILATGGLTEKDVVPVLIPNVIRGAEDFTSGAADMFFFAFGAPKVREVDATVGGIRTLEIPESGMAAAKKLLPEGYLSPAVPNGFFIGVDHPMGVYTWDNMIFTNAKVPDDVIYKAIETMEKNKPDLIAIQPALREFSAANLYKKYDIPYHPGALKYFKDHNIEPKAVN